MGNSGITMHVGRELKTDRQLHETVLVSVRNHKVQRNRVRKYTVRGSSIYSVIFGKVSIIGTAPDC